MMKYSNLNIYGQAVPIRPRVTRRITHTPAKTKEWERIVFWLIVVMLVATFCYLSATGKVPSQQFKKILIYVLIGYVCGKFALINPK